MNRTYNIVTWLIFFVIGPIGLSGLRLAQTDPLPSTLIEIANTLVMMSVPMFVYGHLVFAIVWIGGNLLRRYRRQNGSMWLLALVTGLYCLVLWLCIPIFITAYAGVSMTEVPGTAMSMIQDAPIASVLFSLILLQVFGFALWSEKQRRDKKAP